MYACALGVIRPMFYTGQTYTVRKFSSNYKTWDLALDAQIFEHACYTLMYIFYLTYTPFIFKEFAYGILVGLCFLIGK